MQAHEDLEVVDATTPLGVFLVKSDSCEEKLLFRYPFNVMAEPSPVTRAVKNRYALVMPEKTDTLSTLGTGLMNPETNIGTTLMIPSYTELASAVTLDYVDQEDISKVISISDAALSSLFGAISVKLCDKKFEVKVDNVRFVGHPTKLKSNNHFFQVVFALKGYVSSDVVRSYYDLSKLIAIAIKSEENRCGFFQEQINIMIGCHDDVGDHQMDKGATHPTNREVAVSPYELILANSKLAQNLKTIFMQLKEGIVQVRINNWINVHFCHTQKVLITSPDAPAITPANIHACLKCLRPYHTFLLLKDRSELIKSLPLDTSPTVARLIQMANPFKNLLEISSDADITITQVFNIVAQLIYWGKATIIFPLCEKNVYMLHPSTPTGKNSELFTEFEEEFPGHSLLEVLSKFSLGVSLSQLKNPMENIDKHNQLVQMVLWMLKKRLLLQQHTYVFMLAPGSCGTNRLSFNQPPLGTADTSINERPSSSLTDTFEGSTTASSYQSEDMLGMSPGSVSGFKDYRYNSLSNTRDDEDEDSEDKRITDILRDIHFPPESIRDFLTIPAASNLEDVQLFARLMHLFDGTHHIEDIMYYENLTRSQILTLIDKFQSVLMTFQYEDTTVAELLPYKLLH